MVAVVVLGQVVRWSGGRLRRLKRDERGAVLVQALLILPILTLAVFGGYTVWKVAFVKQSLHSGTYQATRYLCLNPVERPVRSTQKEWEEAWGEVVEEILRREVMENNGLTNDEYEPVAIVEIDGNELHRGLSFTVKTELKLRIGIPFLDRAEPLTLSDQHDGWVE